MAKRNFSQAERDAAVRLRRLWNQQKRELHLTQEKVAHLCGWSTQGAFSQYLLGRIPLNTEAVFKIAKAIQVAPESIMPEIADLLSGEADQPLLGDSVIQLALAIKSLPEKERVAIQTLVDSLTDLIATTKKATASEG